MRIQPRTATTELSERIEAIESSIKFNVNEAILLRDRMDDHRASADALRGLRDEYVEILAALPA